MVNDQEPRYRLVDADGNVVGSLFAQSDGTLKLQEGTSGNDNELSLTTQGTLDVEQLTAGNVVLDSGSNVTEIRENVISVGANSSEVIFDKTTAVDVVSGTINGDLASNVEFTFGDGSTLFISRLARGNAGTETFNTINIPPAKNVTKLQFDNIAGSSKEFGYSVLTV